MTRRIRVRGIPRPEPDVRLYALALIELARQLQGEQEVAKENDQSPVSQPGDGPEEDGDD